VTNKRKIQILEKVIKRFEKVVKDFDEDCFADYKLDGRGICNHIYSKFLTFKESERADKEDKFFEREFKLRLPKPKDEYGGWCWSMDKKGYQSRINACKKAIERLSK